MDQHTPPNLLRQYHQFEPSELKDQSQQSIITAKPGRKKNSITMSIIRVIFFAILFFIGAGLLLIILNIKQVSAVASSISQAKTNLEESLQYTQNRDFLIATDKAQTAVNNFKIASEEIDGFMLGPAVYIPFVKNYKSDAERLTKGGELLATAMTKGTTYAASLNSVLGKNTSLGFSKLPPEEKRRILASIYNSEVTLREIEQLLDQSLTEINSVQSFDWIAPLTSRIKELTEKITTGQKTLVSASPLTKILPSILGYPEAATYLFILQNSDELRATGGFIGTYGIIQTKDGDFNRFETHDVYHLDIPVQDKIKVTPPEALKKYLNKDWYFRDANWSPDWPTSAEKLLEFYILENNAQAKPDPIKNFDGVIAITPEIITELMKITGPITVDGETYTSQNFVDLLQYKVEKDFVRLGVSNWQRKEVIAEIAKTLKERLLDLPLDRWPELIRLVGDNMARKNVLLYDKDPVIKKLILEQGWGGEMKATWGDYLMVVDSNMAALKTDAVMKRQIDYKVEQGKDGDVTATATLNYSHEGSLDWKTSRYQSFTRLYVPEGSRLLKTTGFAPNSEMTGNELGRTYFGGYVLVPPHQTAQIIIQYKLPRRIVDNMTKYKNYGLFIQKQPGTGQVGLSVDATFLNKIKSYEPVNLYSETPSDNRFTTTGDVKIDRNFLITF
jgi:hypothetical protein